ncbi:putative ABC transporter ATP-binding protein YheS [Planctomycetes bacterium Poly30]|uniref:Putative ABC transporter ATP-binding protein YheS n=1 Tax=Saltatorellus ferox TaxID=2528018 RepID=A0A518ET20_9BACT|nr:putative ABC transporter ATP-binding protein YheS [Planctomycetes bacterium Poly30]
MLTLNGITKSYGSRTLFAAAALQVNRGDRIGLVGPNGAGKSTLFSLILGEEAADEGRVSIERDTVIGYLPQESAPVGEETVLEIALAITDDFVRMHRLIKAREQKHPDGTQEGEGGHDEAGHDDVHERYNELNGYFVEAKAKQILSGLGFRDSDLDRPARTLSGGWVMRAHLARLLTQEPDLLMLDEPTNHLDLESLLWFQGYLKGYPGAILVISHDREFLDALATAIVEIRHQKLVRYTGNYTKFLKQREAADAQHLAAYRTQQKEIAHLQAFVDRFKAKATKAAQAQSKLRQIERMDVLEAPESDDKKVGFRFPQPPRSGQKVIWLDQVHFGYGENRIYRGVDLEVQRGERIVLVGPNGAGKSTLLKLLADKLKPDRGERGLGHNVSAGYYSQYRVEMLKPGRTVLEEAMDTEAKVTEQAVRTLLGSFLFSGDSVFKRIEVLSGGEKSRLALVKLLLDPPNLLLMDEPTTHLDISSIDALVAAMTQFEGTLVFISHDVHFIKSLANKVIHTAGGRLTPYLGDYEFYLHKTNAASARAALTVGDGAAARSEGKPAGKSGQPALQKANPPRLNVQKQKKIVQALETEIDALESRNAVITGELELPETWKDGVRSNELGRELNANTERLAELSSAWETEAGLLELG